MSALRRFLNAHDEALSKHVERFLDPRQFGGVPGIEHPPHFLLVAAEFPRQLRIGDSRLSHRQIESRLRSHLCRDGNQPFPPRAFRRLGDLSSAVNPPSDRLLQAIRGLPECIFLSLSLRDRLWDIAERNHEDARHVPTPKPGWIYKCAHSRLLHLKSLSLCGPFDCMPRRV